MSGGHYDYFCWKMDELDNEFRDKELDDLWSDLKVLVKELEWWQSCDTSEETYRKAVSEFKTKWFGTAREDRLKSYIDDQIFETKEELLKMIGAGEDQTVIRTNK